MIDSLPAVLEKLDRAIRLLENAISNQAESPRSDVRIALEDVKSAREALAAR